MADKYEDLHDRIADEIHWDATVIDVLRWLDDHPDQAPGRTITKTTNVERLVEMIRENGYDIRHNGNRSGAVALALDLDSRGVKAPGGEDGE